MTIDQARWRKAVARWHRRFAVIVSLWLVFLAGSGIVINHAHDWGLDRKPLSAALQRWVYGIETTGEQYCETAQTRKLDCSGVFARLILPAGTLLLNEVSLLLLDESGQLIEKLGVNQLGLDRLQAGYIEGSRVYLRDEQKTIITDTELMGRQLLDPQAAAALNGRDWQVRTNHAGNISWERLVLDLHAARFLGPLAKSFNDLMAALILVLALSGLWLYRLKIRSNGNSD
jgi:hypothetical protein